MSKKLLSVLAVVAMLAALVSTTALAEMNLEVGAKGGINIGDIWGSDADSLGVDTSSRVGFLGGAFLGATFNENFGARLEVLYAQRGQKSTIDDVEYTMKLDYVEIALYGTASYPASDMVSVYGFAGPYVGFNSKAEISNGETEDIKDNIKSTDFGLGGGAGVSYMATDMLKIFLEAQYNIGLMSIDDSDSDWTVKNQGVGVTVGVGVPLSTNGGGM
jgi:opacity protein-like surface antigen